MKPALPDLDALAKPLIFLALAYLFLGQITPAILDMWQETHVAGTLTVSPPMRARLVDALADKMSRYYVDAAKGAQIAAFVRKAEHDGEYDDLSSPHALAQALTTDVRLASGDLHARVEFSGADVPDFGDRSIAPVPNDEVSLPVWLIDRLGRWMAHFGVEDVNVSADGIGTLRINGFFRPYLAGEKYATAMNALAGSRGLIIDLRDCGGGNKEGAALLASYFFDRPIHLSDVEYPRTGERTALWTRTGLEGKGYGSARPVIILTSRRTFSAAEDFAYALQTRKRAIVVGEVTRGGAHPVAPFRLASHFLAHIPVGQTISPVTHTNWEGTGIQPDVPAPAARAMETAVATILKR